MQKPQAEHYFKRWLEHTLCINWGNLLTPPCMLSPAPLNAPQSFSFQFLQQLLAAQCTSCRMDAWRCKEGGEARLRADWAMGEGGAGLGAAWCRNNKGSPRKKVQRNEGGRERGKEGKESEGGQEVRRGERGGGKPREAPAAESAHRNEDPASPLPLQPLPCTLLQPHSPCPHYN